MLMVRPNFQVPGELKEGSYMFIFRPRVEKQRVYVKEGGINVVLKGDQAAQFLMRDENLEISLDLKSDKVPVEFRVKAENEKIRFSAKSKENEISVEASKAEFKLLQILIEASLPGIYGWFPSLSDNKFPGSEEIPVPEPVAPVVKDDPVSAAARFFGR